MHTRLLPTPRSALLCATGERGRGVRNETQMGGPKGMRVQLPYGPPKLSQVPEAAKLHMRPIARWRH